MSTVHVEYYFSGLLLLISIKTSSRNCGDNQKLITVNSMFLTFFNNSLLIFFPFKTERRINQAIVEALSWQLIVRQSATLLDIVGFEALNQHGDHRHRVRFRV